MTPQERVLAFVADWTTRWNELVDDEGALGASQPGNARWTLDREQLRGRHFVPGPHAPSDGSLAADGRGHASGREKIEGTLVHADGARVRTRHTQTSTYFEYRLERVEDDWLLREVESYDREPPPLEGSPPLFPEDARAAILAQASPSVAFEAFRPREVPDGDRLFSAGREVTRGGESSRVEVHQVGDLTTTSGILGVRDFLLVAYDLRPLARRVTPGTYPVEMALAFGRPAAVRVRLGSARPAASWHPATFAGGGNVVGVDTANVSIFDVQAMLRLDEHAKERLDEETALVSDASPDEMARMLSIAESHDAVVVLSGFGDGAYPCYWGVDDAGEPTALVVDFLVLAEFQTAT